MHLDHVHTLSYSAKDLIASLMYNMYVLFVKTSNHVKPKKTHCLLHEASHACLDNQPLTCNMLRHGIGVGLLGPCSTALTLVVLTPLLSQEVHGWSATWLGHLCRLWASEFVMCCICFVPAIVSSNKQQFKRFYSF